MKKSRKIKDCKIQLIFHKDQDKPDIYSDPELFEAITKAKEKLGDKEFFLIELPMKKVTYTSNVKGLFIK